MEKIDYKQLAPAFFDQVIGLGNKVHGDNYLDPESLARIYHKSIVNGINASWVALICDELVGFRLTLAADQWEPDHWCTPDLWNVASKHVCYFKCNTVDERYRSAGIGSRLLSLSINCARQQGSHAGLAHIWLASPGNSAFRYFSKCGGELIKKHPGKWRNLSIDDGYCCPVCPDICECVAAEMIIHFK